MKRRLTLTLVLVLLFSALSIPYARASMTQETSAERFFRLSETPENIKKLLTENNTTDEFLLTRDDNDDASIFTLRAENPETGEGIVKVHSVPVKYADDKGELQFIDTSMKAMSFLERITSEYSYKNAANAFTVKYGSTADKGLNFNDAFTIKPKSISAESKAISQKAENGAGKLVYQGVFGPNTRVEYINTECGIKENIILDKYTGQNRFDFIFQSDSHIPVLTNNGMNILIADKNEPSKIEYRFLSLYAYDSYKLKSENNEFKDVNSSSKTPFRHLNEDLYYELTKNADETYTITVVVPEEYLKHPKVVYPVIIDPSIVTVSNNSNSHDSYVWAANPNSNYGSLDYIRFGNNNGKMFGYHRFTSLPNLNGATITNATLKFTFRSGQTTGYTGLCYIVTAKQWNETSITWNNQPYGNWGYSGISHNGFKYYNFPVTDFVELWYSGTPNYGVDFTYSDESYPDYNSVVSSEGAASSAPVLTINYTGGSDIYRNLGWSYMFRTYPYSTPFYGLTQECNPPTHLGVDIAAPAGTPVYSTTSGTVMARGWNNSMGYFVVIKTNSSDSLGRLITRNMHFKSAPPVSLNQTASSNTLIGYVGSTGQSTGNHLHFDVNNMGTWDGPTLRNNPSRVINPRRFW